MSGKAPRPARIDLNTTTVDGTARAKSGVLRFFVFAVAAFGPGALASALGVKMFGWAYQNGPVQLPADLALGGVGLLVLFLVAPIGTYALWKRTGDRLIRGLILLFVYEILLFAVCLYLGLLFGHEAPGWTGFSGHPLIPVFASGAAILISAQGFIFPSAVIVTLVASGRIPAAGTAPRRNSRIGTVLAVGLAIVIPSIDVAAHIGWTVSREKEHQHLYALGDAVADISQALDEYAAAHAGLCPPDGVSWEPGDTAGMAQWFRSYAATGRDSSEMAVGHLPDNPYSGRRYRVGVDFYYNPNALKQKGDSRRYSTREEVNPFRGLSAPGRVPGTVVVLGYTPPGSQSHCPTEYAVVAYARDFDEPWHEKSGDYWVFGVSPGPRPEDTVPSSR